MEDTNAKQQTEETEPCDVNVNVKPVKEKKPLSEDRLQKLAKAREIALKKRLENAKITQKEKELKRLSYEIRNKEVDERLQKLKQDGGEPQPTRCKVEDKEGSSESEDEVIEIVRKNKSSKKKKIRKRIIELSSSSSSESEDESTIIKRHYKAKYKMSLKVM
jgi:hypothetical protein